MVKGALKIRSFAQSKEESSMKAKETNHNTSPSRPPLSAFSSSARNNLSAGNISPIHPASNSQAKFDRRSSQVKIREGLSGQVSYPHLENAESNIGSSSSNSSSPERFSSSSGTPLKGKLKSSGSRQLPLGSADLEKVKGQKSTGIAFVFQHFHSTKSVLEFKPRAPTISQEGLTLYSACLPFFSFTWIASNRSGRHSILRTSRGF